MQAIHFNGHYSIRVENAPASTIDAIHRTAMAVLPNVPSDALLPMMHPNGIEVICDDRYDARVKEAFSASLDAVKENVKGISPDAVMEFQENEASPVNETTIQSLRYTLQQPEALGLIKANIQSFERFQALISEILQRTHSALAGQ